MHQKREASGKERPVVPGMSAVHQFFRSMLQECPHISYYDATNGHLKYAVKTGTVWTTENVDSRPNVGIITSLALDGTGNPRINYRDGGNGDLGNTNRDTSADPELHRILPGRYRSAERAAFSDTSIGGSPSCWNWSFGDGAWFNTSSAANGTRLPRV